MQKDSTTEPKAAFSSQLRTGFTTGACSAAAAKGAALMLVHQTTVREVSITLPRVEIATFHLHGQHFSADTASCHVVKDAGDDPDVTNGAEVHACVRRIPHQPHVKKGESTIIISGGEGIGKVTKPGLAIPPGEWAINPVPRRMIEESVACALFPTPEARTLTTDTFLVTISIPDGEERAKKTLNARLGIIGGLSILGTTGIVRPISAKAWTDTIDAALDVAKACGCATVVFSTGRTSEMAAQRWLTCNPPPSLPYQGGSLFLPPDKGGLRGVAFPEEAYIMMGDHIAYAVQAASQRGFQQPVIASQFAKLLKIACGHENTHAAASDLDLAQLLTWGEAAGLSLSTLETIAKANTAREIAIAIGFDPQLLELLFLHTRLAIGMHASAVTAQFLLADYNGNCIFNSR